MLCWLHLENTLQIQFRMMLTLSHQFSCQNYLPLSPWHFHFYISSDISSYRVTSTQKARGISLKLRQLLPWLSIWTEVKSRPLLRPGWLRPVTLCYSQSLQEQPVFIFKHTEYFPASGSELSSLCQECFPLHKRAAESLASFRSLLSLHLKRAVAADSLVHAEDHSLSFHGFIILFVLCCHLLHYPFVCLLARSLFPGECKLEGRDFLWCLLLCLQCLIDCWCLCVKGKWPSCTCPGRLEQCLWGKTHGDWSNNKSPVAHCIAGHCTEI